MPVLLGFQANNTDIAVPMVCGENTYTNSYYLVVYLHLNHYLNKYLANMIQFIAEL